MSVFPSIRLFLFLILICAASAHAQTPVSFETPGPLLRKQAIGELLYSPDDEKKAFSESAHFPAKTAPNSSDWLANHREPGQTFDQYLRSRRNPYRPPRTTLYVQPLNAFPDDAKTILDQVVKYAEIFFDAKVVLQAPIPTKNSGITERLNPLTQGKQLLSTDVLKHLGKDLPADAYARIAVTMTDLYPDPSWNFVFGQASFRERVGVYSFARYGAPGTPQFLRRCLQIFTHETGHMFGFYHCIHYQCLMNGSNHLGESDQTPVYLCPVCLRKLHAANSFNIRKRYEKLEGFYRKNGLPGEADWFRKRIEALPAK